MRTKDILTWYLKASKNFVKKPAEHLPFDEKPTPYNALKSVTTPILEFISQ